jgi:outer membrane receptor protein involved in Fe transport
MIFHRRKIARIYGGGINIVAPINIKPEFVNDYELGARYQVGGLSVSGDIYREDFKDAFIDATNEDTDISTETNGGSQFINQADLGTASPNSEKPYNVANWNATYDLPIATFTDGVAKTLRFGFQIDNLFGARYFSNAETTSSSTHVNYIQAEPAEPRSFFGSVSVLF